MGVEWQLLRSDNKTIFDLNKGLGARVLDVIYSKEQLLEYLTIWHLQATQSAGASIIATLILRDRLLHFVDGSKLEHLRVVPDSWYDDEHLEIIDYNITHDRFFSPVDAEIYFQCLRKEDDEDYIEDPLAFYKRTGIQHGLYLADLQRRLEEIKISIRKRHPPQQSDPLRRQSNEPYDKYVLRIHNLKNAEATHG